MGPGSKHGPLAKQAVKATGELYRRLRCFFVTSTDDDVFYLKEDRWL